MGFAPAPAPAPAPSIDRTTIVKETTTTITSDSTLTADPDLQAPVLAGVTYHFILRAFFEGTGSADFQHQLTGPAVSECGFVRRSFTPGGTAGTHAFHSAFMTAPGSNGWTGTLGDGEIYFEGIFTPSVNGTIAFEWAQNILDVGATSVVEGSFLILEETP